MYNQKLQIHYTKLTQSERATKPVRETTYRIVGQIGVAVVTVVPVMQNQTKKKMNTMDSMKNEIQRTREFLSNKANVPRHG